MNPYNPINTGLDVAKLHEMGYIVKNRLSISADIIELLKNLSKIENWEGPYRTQWLPKLHCRNIAEDILKKLDLINLDVIP